MLRIAQDDRLTGEEGEEKVVERIRRLRVQTEFLYAPLERHAIHAQQSRCLTDVAGALQKSKFNELFFNAIWNIRLMVRVVQ